MKKLSKAQQHSLNKRKKEKNGENKHGNFMLQWQAAENGQILFILCLLELWPDHSGHLSGHFFPASGSVQLGIQAS